MKKIITAVAIAALFAGCTRIQTGEVGVRIDMNKQIQQGELQAGSWNQTVFGEVVTFPVKDITVNIDNKTPLTSDNSALDDFDLSVIYSVNQVLLSCSQQKLEASINKKMATHY
jgi:hypothetical protein